MSNEKAPSLFDSLTAGFASGAADGGAPDDNEEIETEVAQADAGAEGGEAAGDEGAEGEEAEGAEGAEGEEAEGEEGAEGEEAEGEEAGEEGAEGAPGAKKPAAKEPDVLNDPIPKGTLIPTQKRVEKLIGMVKERDTAAATLVAERDTAITERDEIIGAITDSGMDANKFGVLLDYARCFNSGVPEEMENAYQILVGELKVLATALGKPVPGVNPLAAHPDLVKLVDEKKLTPELALETAMNRNRDAAYGKLRQAQSTRTTSVNNDKAAQAAGTEALGKVGKELLAQDGKAEYTRKAQIAVDMLKDTMPNINPKLWAATFKNVYSKIPAAAKAPAPNGGKPNGAKPPVKKGAPPQPLRGNKRPSGNSAKGAPKTLLDAVKGAFTPDA